MSGYITFEERLEIESMIFQRCSFGEIAKKINKDRSTISREIRRHSVIEKSGYSGFGFNACVHKETCKMGMVCGDKCVKTSCKLCRTCGHCNDYCPKFAEQICILRIKPPYVCNGCDERNKCTLEKTVYSAVQANIMAEQEISISRKGALCDEAEIARLNAFVSESEKAESKRSGTSFGSSGYDEEDEIVNELEAAGLDLDELEYMDDDERYEALTDAGLDPDDFDF